MTTLRHHGHANEGTSIMAFEVLLNCQLPGNLYSELMGIFLEFVSKCVFEIAKECELSTINAAEGRWYTGEDRFLFQSYLWNLCWRGPALKVQVFELICE